MIGCSVDAVVAGSIAFAQASMLMKQWKKIVIVELVCIYIYIYIYACIYIHTYIIYTYIYIYIHNIYKLLFISYIIM